MITLPPGTQHEFRVVFEPSKSSIEHAALRWVARAAGPEERLALAHVRVETWPSAWRLTATDGHRAHQAHSGLLNGGPAETIYLPRAEVLAILAEDLPRYSLQRSTCGAFARIAGRHLISLGSPTYPDVDRTLASVRADLDTRETLPLRELRAKVKAANGHLDLPPVRVNSAYLTDAIAGSAKNGEINARMNTEALLVTHLTAVEDVQREALIMGMRK